MTLKDWKKTITNNKHAKIIVFEHKTNSFYYVKIIIYKDRKLYSVGATSAGAGGDFNTYSKALTYAKKLIKYYDAGLEVEKLDKTRN